MPLIDLAQTTTLEQIATRLPPFPAVVSRLLILLEREEVSLDELVRLARNDPVITGDILATANRLRRLRVQPDLSDLFAAATLIGSNQLRRIAVAANMNRFLACSSVPSHFFQHALAVAIVAQELAMMAGKASETAFVAGILHDIGQLGFYVLDAQAYGALRRQALAGKEMMMLERTTFGVDHCQLGQALARYWQLPEVIGETIAAHHACPDEWCADLPPLINLAETLSAALDLPYSIYNRVHSVSRAALAHLQLRWDDPEMHDCFCRCRIRFAHQLAKLGQTSHDAGGERNAEKIGEGMK